MRHRQRGRHLGRTSSHRKALMRNLACCLILTERDTEYYDGLFQADGRTVVNPPSRKGRIITTLHKAKEVRPLVEKCITIAKKSIPHEESAREFSTDSDRNSDDWRKWRKSDQWQKWAEAMAPAVAARRRVFQILRDKEAVEILFEDIAPRFSDRPGGYTRVMRLATPRLGDAGTRAILEFVGINDRVKKKSEKPSFVDDEEPVAEDQAAVEDEPADVQDDAEGADSESTGDDEAKVE